MNKILCPHCNNEFFTPTKTTVHVGNIPELLFKKIGNIKFNDITGFYVCSPFLSALETGNDFLKKVGNKKFLSVITKPPEEVDQTWNQWHSKQIDFLKNECKAKISEIVNLHAKMYILQAGDMSFAMIGSMNLTGRARKNIEAAIFTTDSSIFHEQWHVYTKQLIPMSRPIS